MTLPQYLLRFRRPGPFWLWAGALALVIAAAAVGGVIVLWKGLVVTNLNDLVPWGLWITIDLSSIALSAGAFLLCAAVYLLGLKRFQPVARTATFVGLIGYSMAMLCLFMDIGQPFRFWHALVYWNTHSVMWEVSMCIMCYFTVLLFETMPIIAQAEWFKSRLPRLAGWMSRVHHYAPVLALIGLGLSSLHQSSLGALYGVLKARPIWYKPDLSVLFILSAAAAGPAMTVLASMLAGRLTPKAKVDDSLLDRLALVIGWILVGYLYFRFWDAFSMTYTYWPGRNEGLSMLTSGELSFNFWFGEILFGALVPAVLLILPRFRRIPWVRMLALALVVGGVVAYRWDTNLVGQLVLLTYLPTEIVARYTEYTPALVEWVVGAGIVAYGLLAFSLGVRYLNIVDHRQLAESEAHAPSAPRLAPTPAGD
ncbi:MAG: polysulfide reductase NrfD [Anaerolineales bacterium]|nr:polysulfide reductase NrfD [Anaerolineales bacterium]